MENNENSKNQYYSDTEFDLSLIFSILKKNVISIILMTSFFAIGSVLYALYLPNIYVSKSVLKISDDSSSNSFSNLASEYSGIASLAGISIPTGGGDKSDYAIELIKSKEFIKHISKFNNIKKNVMAIKKFDHKTKTIIYDDDLYDTKDEKWVRTPPSGRSVEPSYLELHSEISKYLKISKDRKTNFIKISFEHQSPIFAYQFLNLIINELNKITKQIDMDESQSSLNFLYKELPKINEKDVRDSMNKLIESQLKIQMLANVRSDYMLKTIDTPYIPEIKSEPARSIICLISTIAGLMISIIFVLARSFLIKD